VTIGDKGSYAYINFGALISHEENARSAMKAALELRNKIELQLQMGITQGLMLVGAYGGETRKTFGALGNDVNLAARLMTSAAEGEVLLSIPVHKAVTKDFICEPRLPVPVKGKAELLTVFALTGERQQRAIRLQEPTYALPMVGRTEELQIINDKLDLAEQGRGQVIGIVAEAGMGKSRLVAEVIRLARKNGFTGYGGACQSDAVNTPYQTWKSVWGAFFDVDPSAPLKKQMRNIEGEIEDRAPDRVEATPLLNAVLDLNIPENDFTKNLEPKIRQSALHALLEDCLKAQATDEPTLIVIEDMHWIDALSYDLLEQLARALADHAVCFVLAYRPPQLQRLQAPRIEAMQNFTKIELHELNQAEAESAIRAKLLQLYPARGGALPEGLVDALMRRAQGNPFYLEELLNYVRDRGLDPADFQNIELPDSLHTLILSRIDQLSESEKTTLRVASIVGRLFRAQWLTGYYPELGSFPQVKVALDELHKLDITPLDSPEPELAYLFKHIVTHEVTYESLPFATRARLHEQLARYLETIVGATRESPLLDTITFHYLRSENKKKQIEYLRKASASAYSVSAYITAVEYSTRLLELVPTSDPARAALAFQLADTHYNLGDYPAARGAIAQAQAAAQTDADRASALALLGEIKSMEGDYAAAGTILAQAVPQARASRDRFALCRALRALGYVYWQVGKLDDARAAQEESLALARDLGDVTGELVALNLLGLVHMQTDLNEAEQFYTELHTRAVAVGNREHEMTALGNLGSIAASQKDHARARDFFKQAMALARETGVQYAIVVGFGGLAYADLKLGDLSAARAGLHEGLALALRLGLMPYVVALVATFAELAYAEGQTQWALTLMGLARKHPAWSSDHQRDLDRVLAEWVLDPSVVEAGLAKGAALDWDETIGELLK
jgi:tetratricopeptide (TPR) repeat protein